MLKTLEVLHPFYVHVTVNCRSVFTFYNHFSTLDPTLSNYKTKLTLTLYEDFEKAFDKVPHRQLIS